MYYPPFRYGMVEEDLYRGAYPKERNYKFLRRLHLRTILSLTPDPPTPSLQNFCSSEGITHLHIRVDKAKESVPLSFQRMGQILQSVIDPNNHPLYIHCLDGIIVTGVTILCLRKLQLWSISAAVLEYTRFAGVAKSEETEFVEKFQTDLEISKVLPKWLWGGSVSFKKHPSLKVRFRSSSTINNNGFNLGGSGNEKQDEKVLKNIGSNAGVVRSSISSNSGPSSSGKNESERKRAITTEMFLRGDGSNFDSNSNFNGDSLELLSLSGMGVVDGSPLGVASASRAAQADDDDEESESMSMTLRALALEFPGSNPR